MTGNEEDGEQRGVSFISLLKLPWRPVSIHYILLLYTPSSVCFRVLDALVGGAMRVILRDSGVASIEGNDHLVGGKRTLYTRVHYSAGDLRVGSYIGHGEPTVSG